MAEDDPTLERCIQGLDEALGSPIFPMIAVTQQGRWDRLVEIVQRDIDARDQEPTR